MHKIARIKKPGEFIRLCARVSENHQYENFAWREQTRRHATLLDAITASHMVRVWKGSPFSLRRKMLRAIDKVGPVKVAVKLMSVT